MLSATRGLIAPSDPQLGVVTLPLLENLGYTSVAMHVVCMHNLHIFVGVLMELHYRSIDRHSKF